MKLVLTLLHGDLNQMFLQDVPSKAKHALDLKAMFTNAELADCVIKCQGGEEVPCHKAMLAARSPVFKAMFTNHMQENITGTIEVQVVRISNGSSSKPGSDILLQCCVFHRVLCEYEKVLT
eukprot:TRINITY_DN1768_c0_g1_i6.p1 TRINITY_DN1768_c0_g1~~TRINITY_DN1768_c0_g1_i6.p1  ORF type:complete len:121 (-),score=11.88 TRINITY_DN1768_c0_g1_i6:1136-1498(-)